MFNNTDIVIKYQIYPEDLDTLVSVRSDEDLRYMLEEYNRHDSIPRSPSSSPRFRIFVFPSTKITSSTPSPTHRASKMPTAIGTPHTMVGFNSPSPGTSPPNSVFNSTVKSSSDGPRSLGLQRVRSTPNLSQMGNGGSNNSSSNNGNMGSPLVGSGLSNNSAPLHYNQPPQYRNMGQHGGNMSRVGVSYRYETCVCGRVILGHQRRRRRNQYPQFGGHMCSHHNVHNHECHGVQNNSSVNGSVNLGGSSPRLRQTSIWE